MMRKTAHLIHYLDLIVACLRFIARCAIVCFLLGSSDSSCPSSVWEEFIGFDDNGFALVQRIVFHCCFNSSLFTGARLLLSLQ